MLHLGTPCTGKDIDSNEHFPNSDLTPYSALKWALFGKKGAIQNFKTGKVLSPLTLGKTNHSHFCPKYYIGGDMCPIHYITLIVFLMTWVWDQV